MNRMEEHACYRPISEAIQVIGGKWSYFVISQLCTGTGNEVLHAE